VNLKRNILLALLILSCIFASARPARFGTVTLSQPDGYSFCATLRGDEYAKMMTTADGAMIIQDKDGWWCYAYMDSFGHRQNTNVRVSKNSKAPAASLNQKIPANRRNVAIKEIEGIAKRLSPTRGTNIVKHAVVIPVEFQDKKMKYSREDFTALLTEKGYSRSGATGSAKDYYEEQFGSGWEFSFDISNIITLSKVRGWYGANNNRGEDIRPGKMVEEACLLADNEIDFSKYDDDGDGEVENIFIFFAGEDEADGAAEECIWSHFWYLESGAGISLSLDGVKINRYACASELSRHTDGKYYFAGIGTFCHEFGHSLGLQDLYDTDYCGEGVYISAGLWLQTALMDGGNMNNEGNTPPYLNAVERDMLGIEAIKLKPGEYTLEPIGKSGTFYRLDTDREGEYYLFECRGDEKWDKYINGDGMLIYHIDKSDYDSGYSEIRSRYLLASERWKSEVNEINSNPDHQCADLVEADGRADKVKLRSYSDDLYGIFYPSGENDRFSALSKPPMKWWSGEKANFCLRDIKRINGNITFTAKYDDTEEAPVATDLLQDIFQDAAILTWSSDRETDAPSYISWGASDGSKKTEEVTAYAPGCYSITLEGLDARKSYSCEIYFKADGIPGEKVACNFTTKSSSGGKPYIYFKGVERNEDGSFPAGSSLPLRVFNAVGANVIWTMDGKRISTDASGYYTVSKGGTLKAEVIYEDGSRLFIVKKIIVK